MSFVLQTLYDLPFTSREVSPFQVENKRKQPPSSPRLSFFFLPTIIFYSEITYQQILFSKYGCRKGQIGSDIRFGKSLTWSFFFSYDNIKHITSDMYLTREKKKGFFLYYITNILKTSIFLLHASTFLMLFCF